uniref:BHLH domain-containing protein n=1 Tax=Macrostomum lignano TaxID=282301 RepID=A0A1I8FB74_9PLAT
AVTQAGHVGKRLRASVHQPANPTDVSGASSPAGLPALFYPRCARRPPGTSGAEALAAAPAARRPQLRPLRLRRLCWTRGSLISTTDTRSTRRCHPQHPRHHHPRPAAISRNPFDPQSRIPLPHPFGEFHFGCESSFIRRRNERERERVRFVNEGYERLKETLPFENKDKRISKQMERQWKTNRQAGDEAVPAGSLNSTRANEPIKIAGLPLSNRCRRDLQHRRAAANRTTKSDRAGPVFAEKAVARPAVGIPGLPTDCHRRQQKKGRAPQPPLWLVGSARLLGSAGSERECRVRIRVQGAEYEVQECEYECRRSPPANVRQDMQCTQDGARVGTAGAVMSFSASSQQPRQASPQSILMLGVDVAHELHGGSEGHGASKKKARVQQHEEGAGAAAEHGAPPPAVVLGGQLEVGQRHRHAGRHGQQDDVHHGQDAVQGVVLPPHTPLTDTGAEAEEAADEAVHGPGLVAGHGGGSPWGCSLCDRSVQAGRRVLAGHAARMVVSGKPRNSHRHSSSSTVDQGSAWVREGEQEGGQQHVAGGQRSPPSRRRKNIRQDTKPAMPEVKAYSTMPAELMLPWVVHVEQAEQRHDEQAGQHYWYNMRKNMNCDDFMPYFLLYNGGKLDGFGFAMTANYNGEYYEHPTVSVAGTFTTAHVYMYKRPWTKLCVF